MDGAGLVDLLFFGVHCELRRIPARPTGTALESLAATASKEHAVTVSLAFPPVSSRTPTSSPLRPADRSFVASPSAFVGPIRWVERGIAPTRAGQRPSLLARLARPAPALAVPLAMLLGVVCGAVALALVKSLTVALSPGVALGAALGAACVAVVLVGISAAHRGTRQCTVFLGRDGVERVTETEGGTVREGVAFEDVAHAIREHEPRTLPNGKVGFKERLLLIDAEGRVLFSLTMMHAENAPRRHTALIGRVQREYLERRIAREVLRNKAADLDSSAWAAIPWRRIVDAEAALAALVGACVAPATVR